MKPNFLVSTSTLFASLIKTSNSKALLVLMLFTQVHFRSIAQVSLYPRLQIDLLLNNKGGPENTADGVMAFYSDRFSAGIGNEDSYKFTNPDENLGIFCQGKILAIEGKPLITNTDTIALQMWQYRQETYVFRLSGFNFSSNLIAVMKDNYLQKEIQIDLTGETFIPFSLTNDTASYALNRFSVIFKTKTAPPPPIVKGRFSLSTSLLNVFPNPVKGNLLNIKMNGMLQGRYLMNLYNTAGQQVYSSFIDYEGGSSTKSLMVNSRLSKGIYKLQLTLKGVTTSKMVLFQ